MSLATFFGFNISSYSDSELPDLFPLNVSQEVFVLTDVVSVYSKILTDCVERTQGISEETTPLLFDNCLQSEASQGLITLLAAAMTLKDDLFLIYNRSVNVIRQATDDEAEVIRNDYKARGNSASGVFVSFKNYTRTDMVKIYSGMEYCVVAGLNKMTNLSKAIQFKMNDMRSSVGLIDSSIVRSQAKGIATSLSRGKDVLMDAKDIIETGVPDISSIEHSIAFLDGKRSFYYCMPLAYINGEQAGGIGGATGEADTRAVERGLKQYYISILKPTLEAIFGIKTSFKSNDFRQITSALEAIKTFELVGDDLLSQENKQIIISKLFDVQMKQ